MVIVNFAIAMGADGDQSLWGQGVSLLQGRAAALFVVLAGVGLGLAFGREPNIAVISKRALFLFVLGLINMTIFEADILHYYAFYFAFSILLLPLPSLALKLLLVAINMGYLAFLLSGDALGFSYDTGWDWQTYTYSDMWTLPGFTRNLWVNGWHPIFPWLSFVVVGILISRLDLSKRWNRWRLIRVGAVAWLGAELSSWYLSPLAVQVDPALADLVATRPIPPALLYIIAGGGFATMVVGVCVLFYGSREGRIGSVFARAGRQSLTLYIAHILVGMGIMELFGLLGGQNARTAVVAAVVFTLSALAYAQIWARHYPRGPLESLLRRWAG